MPPLTKAMILKALLAQANIAREAANMTGNPSLVFLAASLVDATRSALDEAQAAEIDKPAPEESTH